MFKFYPLRLGFVLFVSIFILVLPKLEARVPVFDLRGEKKITILVYGDAGTGLPSQYEVAKAMYQVCVQRRCDLALVLGDNFYPSGVTSINDPQFQTQFEEPYKMFGRFDFWTILGNHDWMPGPLGPKSEIEYSQLSPRWRMPNYEYAVPNLPSWLKIYGIDTTMLNDTQLKNIERQFCADQNSWKVLMGHHPILSSGSHGGTPIVQQKVWPLLRKCGVHMYLAGHDHHQEHLTTTGFETLVQGAGSEVRPVLKRRYYSGDPVKQRFAKSERGFAILEFTSQDMDLRFYNNKAQEIYAFRANPSQVGHPEL